MEKIDNIIRDWFYELPNGYAEHPYSQKELKVLDEVLAKYGTSLNEVDQLDQAFLDAKPVKEKDKPHTLEEFLFPERFITEGNTGENDLFPFDNLTTGDVGKWKGKTNKELAKLLKAKNKKAAWDKFIMALPGGKSIPKVKDMIYNMKDNEAFVDGLSSITKLNDLKKQTPDKTTGIEKTIFDLEPSGVGRGELWLAWKMAGNPGDIQISGPGDSYDLEMKLSTLGPKNYEVKAYHSHSNTTKPFRLGTHGILGRFEFWKNMFETSILIEKLGAAGEDFIDPEDDSWKNLATKIEELNKGKLKLAISKGEIGASRVEKLLDFYEAAHKYVTTIEKPDTYNIVQIKSSIPGNPSKYYSIKPTKLADILGGKITIPKDAEMKDDTNKKRLTQRLISDPYVQNPDQLKGDINIAIQQVSDEYSNMKTNSGNGAGFLVFREDGIKINDKAELQKIEKFPEDMKQPRNVVTLSGGRLYVKELVPGDEATKKE